MIPSDDEKESVSLNDALQESFTAAEDTPAPPAAVKPEVDASALVPEDKPWEAPSWAARWKPEARDALGRFASHPELKTHLDPLQKQIEEIYGYNTRRDQEYAGYRQRLDPVYQVLQPYEQRYALQGMTLQQGVQQLFQTAEFLQQSPDEAFPYLASGYKPSNPGQTLTALAQEWGVDINALDTPYVDPTVSALLTPLQQELASLKQQIGQQQAGYTQAQTASLVQEISAFEEAKDANGSLLHPHFRDVFDDMLKAVNLGYAKSIDEAYALATQINPKVRESAQREAEEAARKKAMEEAAARTVAAEKAEGASRTVTGKGKGSGKETLSLREAYLKAEASLS